MSNQTFFPIVEHRVTKNLYWYRGENIFENVVSKQQGTVSDEQAAKAFVMLPNLSEYANEFVGVVGLLELGAKLVK
jgi:hypothetical protein